MRLDDFCKVADIDKNRVVARFGNNVNLYVKYVGKFVSDMNCQELQNAMAEPERDFKKIEMHSHTLKGVAGNMGFDKLFNLCDKVVAAVRAGEEDSLDSKVDELVLEYNRIVSLINEGVEA